MSWAPLAAGANGPSRPPRGTGAHGFRVLTGAWLGARPTDIGHGMRTAGTEGELTLAVWLLTMIPIAITRRPCGLGGLVLHAQAMFRW
jgi:hypothetical protein